MYVYLLTIIHTLLSLVAIVSGIPVVLGFLKNETSRWTTTNVVTTGLTLVTSFMFPYNGFTPAIGVGILCILIFLPTIYAKYRTSLTGIWRLVWVVGTTALLYFNCFVLIAQSFGKIPPLFGGAPIAGGPLFGIAQGILLIVAIVLGFLAARRFGTGGSTLRVVR